MNIIYHGIEVTEAERDMIEAFTGTLGHSPSDLAFKLMVAIQRMTQDELDL